MKLFHFIPSALENATGINPSRLILQHFFKKKLQNTVRRVYIGESKLN